LELTRQLRAISAGVAAAVAGFIVTYAFSITAGGIFLPELSTQLAIEISPGFFSSFVIEHLGKAGKIGATILAFLVYFIAAALLGLLFDFVRAKLPGRNALQRGLLFSAIPLGAAALFVGLISWLEPVTVAKYSFGASVLSLILLNVTFGVALALLADAAPAENGGSGAARAIQRRPFLFAASVAAGTTAFTFLLNRTLFERLLQAVGAPGGKLPSFVTPNADFYQVSMDVTSPRIDLSRWRLSVGGEAERPLQLSYDELLKLPMVEKAITLECVSNEVGGPLISNARWRGVPLSVLLNQAGLRPSAREIVLQAADAYSDSIPVELGLAADTMLALYMNDKELPRDHGFPVRLLVPGLFGMENVKWLTGIQAVSGSYRGGYWQTRGWTKFAAVKTMSKISVPVADAEVSLKGPIMIGGVAFAGNRGIQKVELGITLPNESEIANWTTVELLPEGSVITWRLWRHDWRPEKTGTYLLVVRATDGAGMLQIAESAPIFPSGSTGYHNVRVRVID
jgi:DMSO/TMAO reductase YedYZ molybdopterin-dependent catalytic subunit